MFLGRPCSSKNTWNLEKKKHDDFDYEARRHNGKSNHKKINKSRHNDDKGPEVTFKNHINQESGINQSSGNIQFESNDLLDEYKK